MNLTKRAAAEFLGTFWLVFGGCGAALMSADYPGLGIGFLGVALAFGLTVLTGVFALGHISGGHFNPAVTVGLWAGGRFKAADIPMYVISQLAGAVAAASVLYVIASGKPGFVTGGFASNGYGDLSPGNYSAEACFVSETVCTFFFLVGFAGIPIGLTLTIIHLVSIPVTNTSVNPARSTGPALLAGGDYIHQLWMFWAAPIAGALLAGAVARLLESKDVASTPAEAPTIGATA
jgi:aquaporin Z